MHGARSAGETRGSAGICSATPLYPCKRQSKNKKINKPTKPTRTHTHRETAPSQRQGSAIPAEEPASRQCPAEGPALPARNCVCERVRGCSAAHTKQETQRRAAEQPQTSPGHRIPAACTRARPAARGGGAGARGAGSSLTSRLRHCPPCLGGGGRHKRLCRRLSSAESLATKLRAASARSSCNWSFPDLLQRLLLAAGEGRGGGGGGGPCNCRRCRSGGSARPLARGAGEGSAAPT